VGSGQPYRLYFRLAGLLEDISNACTAPGSREAWNVVEIGVSSTASRLHDLHRRRNVVLCGFIWGGLISGQGQFGQNAILVDVVHKAALPLEAFGACDATGGVGLSE
jgi:hypothetical protein